MKTVAQIVAVWLIKGVIIGLGVAVALTVWRHYYAT